MEKTPEELAVAQEHRNEVLQDEKMMESSEEKVWVIYYDKRIGIPRRLESYMTRTEFEAFRK